MPSNASSVTPSRESIPSAKSSQADTNAGLSPKPALVARWRKPNQNGGSSTAAHSSNATSFANNSESLVTRGGFHEASRSVVQAQFQAPQAPGVGSEAPFQPPKLDAIPPSPQTPAPNQLRLGQGEGDAPALRTPPVQSQDASPLPLNQFAPPAANQNAELESSRGGTIQLQEPGNSKQEDDKAPAPPSPFPRQPNVDVDSGQSKGDDSPFKKGEDKGAESKRDSSLASMDCEKLRERAMTADISKIKLDVSPSFATDIGEEEKSDKKKAQFARTSPMRQWSDFRGQFIVDGRMVDLRQGQAVIETASGSTVRYNLSDLSDADQLYVFEAWRLPKSCSIGQLATAPRNFMESEVFYRASGLCHKPLYFEDVQLERYGHEVGPVLQPVLSSAHFFANIAVLPYKAGIHPPNECQYALGYYRPGNCAPWTVGPIPISLRGGLMQAAAVTGIAGALP